MPRDICELLLLLRYHKFKHNPCCRFYVTAQVRKNFFARDMSLPFNFPQTFCTLKHKLAFISQMKTMRTHK